MDLPESTPKSRELSRSKIESGSKNFFTVVIDHKASSKSVVSTMRLVPHLHRRQVISPTEVCKRKQCLTFEKVG